ncbi:MAG: hypothetical protein ACTSUQ_07520 [Candidatus Freyarchaeota archaeon]
MLFGELFEGVSWQGLGGWIVGLGRGGWKDTRPGAAGGWSERPLGR